MMQVDLSILTNLVYGKKFLNGRKTRLTVILAKTGRLEVKLQLVLTLILHIADF